MKLFTHIVFFFLLITQICFAQGTWTKIGDMPEIRYGHTADEINGKVYIAGGVNTETGYFPATMLVYDKSANVWDSIPLPNPRADHTSCVVDSSLYLIGGVELIGGQWMTVPDVDIFNTSTGQWISGTSMPTHRTTLDCVLINGKIYVIGGLQIIGGVIDYNGLKTLEVYDLSTETWSTLPDMPTKRWGLSAVAFDGKIFVVGGRTNVQGQAYSSVEVYDSQYSIWTTITTSSMPTARYQLVVCLLNDKIYAIDGWRSSSLGPIYDTVEVYNPITDVWTTETSMPVARARFDGYALNGKIYVYGGSHTTHPNIGTSDIYEFAPSPVSVEDYFSLPLEFTLEQNFPNPFNPSTAISYQLPVSSVVTLKVFDILGNEIATLVDEYNPVGRYEVEFNASALTSGVYFYQLKAGDFIQSKKMILLK